MDMADWVGLIGGMGGLILGLLAFLNQKRDLKIKDKKTDAENAESVANASRAFVDMVNSHLRELDQDNKFLKSELQRIVIENNALKERISVFEKALIESPLYRLFFDRTSLPSSIFNIDDGHIFDSNSPFLKLYGYNTNESMNLTVFDIWKNVREAQDFIDGRTTSGTVWHKDCEGNDIEIKICATYIKYKDTNYIMIVAEPVYK